ncbi:uncharacterized protein LOC120493481, partial [Tachysurus ichikawai]
MSHGSRSSRSSVSSTRLKAEAEYAALLATQQMLHRKHTLEEQEEQLRKTREELKLETKLAESMARILSQLYHKLCLLMEHLKLMLHKGFQLMLKLKYNNRQPDLKYILKFLNLACHYWTIGIMEMEQ